MKIINFFGGPGIGKSTIAAGHFWDLKVSGRSAELVTEYAKDVTWEGRQNLLNDQLYLLAKQNRRLSRLLDHDVDYAITDSPLLLCAAYTRMGTNSYSSLVPLVLELFNSYDNVNIVLKRNPEFYVQVGRSQTVEQAIQIDEVVIALLDEFNIPHHVLEIDNDPMNTLAEIAELY